jgi:hypothetical protein
MLFIFFFFGDSFSFSFFCVEAFRFGRMASQFHQKRVGIDDIWPGLDSGLSQLLTDLNEGSSNPRNKNALFLFCARR